MPENGNGKPKLTKRREKFAEAMANPEIKSQQEAAISAGYSPNGARVTASQLLTNSNILETIKARKQEYALHADYKPEIVLGGTVLRATATIDDVLDDNGKFDIVKARENGAIHNIKKITRTPTKWGETVAVEMYPKDSAQDKLGTYAGLEQAPKTNDADRARELRSQLRSKAADAVIRELSSVIETLPDEYQARFSLDVESAYDEMITQLVEMDDDKLRELSLPFTKKDLMLLKS